MRFCFCCIVIMTCIDGDGGGWVAWVASLGWVGGGVGAAGVLKLRMGGLGACCGGGVMMGVCEAGRGTWLTPMGPPAGVGWPAWCTMAPCGVWCCIRICCMWGGYCWSPEIHANRTLNMLNCFLKIIKDIFTFWIISWDWLDPRRWNELWNTNTCCLSYTANTMSADALTTLGARASAGMVLTTKVGIFGFQHQDS